MNNPEAAKGNIISIMVHHRHDLEKGHIKPDRITSIGAFGFDLSHFTHRTQFCIAASIMFIVFILFGYVQVFNFCVCYSLLRNQFLELKDSHLDFILLAFNTRYTLFLHTFKE